MGRKYPVQKNIENISQFIECVSMVQCSKCHVKETIFLEPIEAAEQFVITGEWTATPNNAYCPTCSRKIRKKKK